MQTNATRDLLTKGSSSWQWDVTGGQSSLHLTSQIKMLNCNPSLKIFKTKCSLTDIKYTPLSDNKTSPVTREVATSPTENWQLSLFALPRVLTFLLRWGVAFDNLLDVFTRSCDLNAETHIQRWVLIDNSGEELNLVFFPQVMEKLSAALSSSDDNPHVMQEDKYRQRWTKCLTNWREHSSHIFKFRHSSRSATPFPLFRLLVRYTFTKLCGKSIIWFSQWKFLLCITQQSVG